MTPAGVPDAALAQWARSLPAVRCVAPALRPWTGAPDAAVVPATPSATFGDHGVVGAPNGFTIVARGGNETLYELALIPLAHAVAFNAGSDPDEWTFTAVVGDVTTFPPRGAATLTHVPRTLDGLGLGSSRAEVEEALGPARAQRRCGYDVVRYVASPAGGSDGEMWFVYRDARVVAFARFEAV